MIRSIRVSQVAVSGPDAGSILVELFRNDDTGGEAVEITLDASGADNDTHAVFIVGADDLRHALR